MGDVVADLVEPLRDRLLLVGARPAANGDRRVEAEGQAVTEPAGPQPGRLVAPAHRALQRLVVERLPDVVDDLEGAPGTPAVVGGDLVEQGPGALRREPLLDVAEVEADHGVDQLGGFVEQTLHQRIGFQGLPARQRDHVARGEAAARSPADDLCVDPVEGEEPFGVADAAVVHGPVLDVLQTFGAVALDSRGEQLAFPADRRIVAGEAKEKLELGEESVEVRAVPGGVHEVAAEAVGAAVGPRQGVPIQPENIGPLPVGLLVPVAEAGPVDLFVNAATEADQILGVKTAADVYVQFAGPVCVQMHGLLNLKGT